MNIKICYINARLMLCNAYVVYIWHMCMLFFIKNT